MSNDPPPWNPAGTPNPAPTPPADWQPGYGAQPGIRLGPTNRVSPGAYPMPPARKPPPKKSWYIVGAVLTVVGLIVAGFGIGVVVNSTGTQPASEHTFRAGGSTTVHIDAGETKVVYIANATAAGAHHVHCDTVGGDSASGSLDMKQYQGRLTLNQWDATFTVTPSQSGDYTIRCTGAPSSTPSASVRTPRSARCSEQSWPASRARSSWSSDSQRSP